MFGGIFKSKKKAEQARATEKKDSFYENDGDDGVAEGDESHMDDEEYGRRVSEEITKRKNNNVTKQTGSAAHKSSTPAVSSKVPPNAQAPPPSAQSAQKVSYPLPAGTAKSTVPAHGAVTSTTPKATPAASVPPVPSAQKAAVVPAKSTASMVPTAPASKPAPIAPVAVASSTSKPNSSTPSPQPMFVNPSSVAAARPNSATSAPVTPRVIATAAAAARPFPATAAPVIVPIDKNVPPLDPKAVQQLVLMGFSYPASMLALQKCNNKSDLAAEFLLEHSEEYINEILTTQAAGRPISPKPILPMPLPVSSTPKSAPVPQHSTPSPQIPSVGIPVTTSKNSTAVLSNPASATGATPPQWMETSNGDAASDKRAKPKEMQAVDTAMAAILAKREALKRQTPPPTPAVTSCLSSPRGGFGTDTSSTYGNGSVFEKLSSYKTKGAALHEQQEEEDRQRKEAQERRRKLLATPASASSNLSPKGAADEIDNQAFEALFNKKTKSMVMTEKQAEEERIAREAYERKWKKVTARDSLGSSNLTSDSEAEVFSKLHATKLKSHKISEQVEQEKKAHLQKVEAVSSGRLGASAPPTADAPLLRKTQSAMMREQFTLEDKQRLEEERAAVERKRREIEGSPVGRRKRGSSVERLHTSSGEDLADSIDRSLRIAARNSLTNSNIDIGDATLVEDEDSEDEGGNEESKPMPVEQTATKRTASSATMARQPSGRGTDFPKQSSFYTKRENMGKTKSFRTTGALGVPGVATRERLPQEVQETAEHLWVCKVVNAPRDGVSVTGRKAEIMVPVKGTYATKQQCQAIALANAPPRWATRVKNAVCGICEEAFNKYLKAENCSNCGQLVCADCSQENWPVSMVPDAFCDKKTVPRVCAACNVLMEKAVAALKAGDFDLVTVLHKTGNVNFHNQYSIFPDAPYAVHCAAASGNLELMKWLAEELFVPSKDVITGDALLNASGLSALTIAARRGDLDMMRYIVHSLEGSVTEIDDVAVLQRALHVALEAPGAPPAVSPSRKTQKSPALASSAASFRRVDKGNSTSSFEDSSSVYSSSNTAAAINTDSLLLKAADLAMRLRAPASARADEPPQLLPSPTRIDASPGPSPPKASTLPSPVAAATATGNTNSQLVGAQGVPTPTSAVISVSSPKLAAATPVFVPETPPLVAAGEAVMPATAAANPSPAPAPALKTTPSSGDAAVLRRAASAARIAAKMIPPAPLQRKPSGNLASRAPLTRTPSSSAMKKSSTSSTSSASKSATPATMEKEVEVEKQSDVVETEQAAEVIAEVEATGDVVSVGSAISEALAMEAAVDERAPALDVSSTLPEGESMTNPVEAVGEVESPVEVKEPEQPGPPAAQSEQDYVAKVSTASVSVSASVEQQQQSTESTDTAAAVSSNVPVRESEDVEPPDESTSETTATATATASIPHEPAGDSTVTPVLAEEIAPVVAEDAAPAADTVSVAEVVPVVSVSESRATLEVVIEVATTSNSGPTTASETVHVTSEETPTAISPSSPLKTEPNGKNGHLDSGKKNSTSSSNGVAPSSPSQLGRSPSLRTPSGDAGFSDTKSSKRMNSMKMEPAVAENPTARMSSLHRTSSGRSVTADSNPTSQPSL